MLIAKWGQKISTFPLNEKFSGFSGFSELSGPGRLVPNCGSEEWEGFWHRRRRIELEDKAKVVASDWGTESLPR